MVHEGFDLDFEVSGQVVVLQQNSVFERLMPALDLALRLRMVWRATNMVHVLVFEPVGQITRDIGRSIVTEQSGFVGYLGAVAA